jgi:hypothetical protein
MLIDLSLTVQLTIYHLPVTMYKPGRHLGVESSEMLSVSDRNGGSRTPRELVNLLHRKIKSVFPNLCEFNLHLHSL